MVLVIPIVGVNAQNTPPNRLLVQEKNGIFVPFVVDYINQVSFRTVIGPVLAEVQIHDVKLDTLSVTITRTPSCNSFRLGIVPTSISSTLDDINAIYYVENNGSAQYYEDFPTGDVTDINLAMGTEYELITIGYDEWDIASGVFRTTFETEPMQPGDPYVEVVLDEATLDSITVTFYPNEDVLEYYAVLFNVEVSSIEEQFYEYGFQMGYFNINDMIVGFTWNRPEVGVTTSTWTFLNPSTHYALGIAVKNRLGEFVPYQTFECTTQMLGGEGVAFVDVELGEYEATDWWGELLPTMLLYFVPNENTSCYRAEVYYAEDFDRFPNEIISEVCSDPPYSNAVGWWLYEPFADEYPLDVSTEFVAITAGKNINGEWGEVNVFRFITPDECPGWNTRSAARFPMSGKGILSKKIKEAKMNARPNLMNKKAIEFKGGNRLMLK